MSATNETVQMHLQVKRLYASTWLWLDHPCAALEESLSQTLKTFLLRNSYGAMATRDYYMVRSAFRWLNLFRPTTNRALENWVNQHFPRELPESKFFDFDERCYAAVLARRKNELVALENDDLAQAQPSILKQLQTLRTVLALVIEKKSRHGEFFPSLPVAPVISLRENLIAEHQSALD